MNPLWIVTLLLLVLFTYSFFDFFFCIVSMNIEMSQKNRIHNYALTNDSIQSVTIQIPVYNTGKNILPLLRSLEQINAPVQLLDSSDDSETEELILNHLGSTTVQNLSTYIIESTKNITWIRFKSRKGRKAWALNEGLKFVNTDYIAVFDSDWEVSEDVILAQLDQIQNKSDIAFVQASWRSINSNQNALAQIDTISVETEHLTEDVVRNKFNLPFTIHGSAFLIRTEVVKNLQYRDAFLSEDVDLAMRIYLNGMKGVYLENDYAFGRTCSSLTEFYRQKRRWIEGRSQMLRTHASAIIGSKKLNVVSKVFTLHYLAYFFKMPIFLIVLSVSFALQLNFAWVFVTLFCNIISKVALNTVMIHRKKQKWTYHAMIEPLMFWLFLMPYSYFSVRGAVVRGSKW
jgi:cellulose synthase/poly-beta-1,6-N-acetylglucosamine synthase-like glycosyltransferase